jgi:hypothetical protein
MVNMVKMEKGRASWLRESVLERYWIFFLAYLVLHTALNITRTPFWKQLLG